MTGDTPYDAQACRAAGIVCLGVRSGGNSAADLLASGARRVYDHTQDILDKLNFALADASPGPVQITGAMLEGLMREALAVARSGLARGLPPIGAVLARGDGAVIGRGYNQQKITQNKAAHAEIMTFADAAGKAPLEARDFILACTLEPCVMCMGAAMECAVETVAFGLGAKIDGGAARITPPQSPENQMPRIIGGILAEESRRLLQAYANSQDASDQEKAYLRRLLAE